MRADDLPSPPDYVLELVDLKANRRVSRPLKMSWTSLQVDAVGRSRHTEYAIALEARKAFRDLEHLAGNWPPKA